MDNSAYRDPKSRNNESGIGMKESIQEVWLDDASRYALALKNISYPNPLSIFLQGGIIHKRMGSLRGSGMNPGMAFIRKMPPAAILGLFFVKE